ncbi:MAG: xylose isomerase [Chloroflexota bacterium]|nr:TIM barrel protein [Anaerolineales bacterium]GIK44071.1 MAG: xylose isomerase [Chloroflexota bacterium]
MSTTYRFSFGPWNIHTGADPFGPAVRDEFSFAEKLEFYKQLGFDGVQFHDDDVVSNADAPWSQQEAEAKAMRARLDERGLVAEFIAPRLWEHPLTVDGAITSNSAEARTYALERTKRAIDIARLMDTKDLVLWPAREGTYLREAKDPIAAVARLVEWMNAVLEYDKDIRILGEMKPNEPMDAAYVPTTGHFLGLASLTVDPSRVGTLIESAHAILAGLDPSDEMAYALAHKKLWSVHLNDQNGLKFDEDKSFGAVDIRRAFNQVWVLERAGYGQNGEFIGLDVKALRTQAKETSTKHLRNSRAFFLRLVELARSLDVAKVEELRAARDYEELDMLIVKHLIG